MSTSTEAAPLDAEFLRLLGEIFDRGSLYTAPSDCWSYGYDNSGRHALPQAVAFPARHEQVVETVRLCNRYRTPLTARGRGTGTTGATVPVRGGLILAMERMNRILEFRPDDRYIVVEPGITNQAVQDAAGKGGFFWPPDPTSAAYCSIGGNLACNSAGPRAVKYGTPRENTLALRAVTGDGGEIRTGVRTTKGVVGYDLTRLLLGSEGTLAVITEATLKLTPLAESKRTLRAIYADVTAAAAAIARIMAQPVIPCALEFIDANAIALIRRYFGAELPDRAGALLMIEVDGPEQAMDYAVDQVAKAARGEGCMDLRTARGAEEIQTLWEMRKALSPALRQAAPQKINEDVAVPVTRLPEMIGGLETLSRRFGLPIVNFGHAGNGNLHVNLLFDPARPGETEKARACLDEVFSLVLKLEGTLSGEHGIGLEKRDYIDRELDAHSLALMHAIKRQFDPNGILNPDKSLPPL